MTILNHVKFIVYFFLKTKRILKEDIYKNYMFSVNYDFL